MYARGNAKQQIYVDDVDCFTYLRLLGAVVVRQEWRCLAYCLMGNHVHLLVETPRPNLGAGMQRLHGHYAQIFNERHGRTGHLFQGRYGSVPLRDDGQLWTVARYIAVNPVRAGLCRRPEDWRWNSYRSVLAGAPPRWLDAGRLLAHFAAAGGDGRRRYTAHVNTDTGSDATRTVLGGGASG